MTTSTLSEAKHGSKGKVIQMRGEAWFHRRLIDMGIYCGRVVEIGEAAMTTGYLQVHINGHALLLSREEASRICLESI